MKILTRLAALFVLAVAVFSVASCGYTYDIVERVENYLAEEYPDKTFDIIDYEKHNNTSGRYEINVRCREDGVKFRMYVYSSISVTDGYSVERANYFMKEVIEQEIGEGLAGYFANIEWHDLYADNAKNYRFRKVDMDEEITLSDIDKLYKVELAHNLSEAEIGVIIHKFVYELCDEYSENCSFESVVFKYKIGRVTYTFTTDSRSVLNLGRDGVIHFVLTNLSGSNSKREIELEYFSTVLDDENDDRDNNDAEDTDKDIDNSDNKNKENVN